MKANMKTNSIRFIAFTAFAALALTRGAGYATAEQAAAAEESTAAKKPASGFSFAVYGDSRSMMYLPYMETQKDEATNAMVDMFELVLPAKVAPEVVKKDVKL